MLQDSNIFIQHIYDDFEQKLQKVFGYTINDLKYVLDRPDTQEREGHDLELELAIALTHGGVALLRREMNSIIIRLEIVYMIDRLGRKPTNNEILNRIEELDIGIPEFELNRYR